MKQHVKYCIIALLAVLFYNDTAQAAVLSYPSPDNRTERCSLSQASHTQQTLHNIYMYFSSISLCMEYTDVSQVPGNKSITLPFSYTRLLSLVSASANVPPLHLLYRPVLHPPVYYVFGLRKIIL